jgi:hypothetical protein
MLYSNHTGTIINSLRVMFILRQRELFLSFFINKMRQKERQSTEKECTAREVVQTILNIKKHSIIIRVHDHHAPL